MRLTVEEHSESLKRFRHINPARGWNTRACAAACPGSTRTCTREKGHSGLHAARGLLGKVLSVWDLGDHAGRPSRKVKADAGLPARIRRGPKRPIGLRSRSPTGPVEALRNIISRAVSSMEELVWLVFFLAFVGFAIGGFLLIYLG